MNTRLPTPVQLDIDGNIGLQLVNAIARRNRRRAGNEPSRADAGCAATGDLLEDIVTFGTRALVQTIQHRLSHNPLEVITPSPSLVILRICGALDYVIDREKRVVLAKPTPLTVSERTSEVIPPWFNPLPSEAGDIDLLNPLHNFAWLIYVAVRPGWFGCAVVRYVPNQEQLFYDWNDLAIALKRIAQNSHRILHLEAAMIALQHQLAIALIRYVGSDVVDLALRARPYPNVCSLNARHLNIVWRQQVAYETMARENPKLLTALSAWMRNRTSRNSVCLTDALPLMRHDVLSAGLQPRA